MATTYAPMNAMEAVGKGMYGLQNAESEAALKRAQAQSQIQEVMQQKMEMEADKKFQELQNQYMENLRNGQPAANDFNDTSKDQTIEAIKANIQQRENLAKMYAGSGSMKNIKAADELRGKNTDDQIKLEGLLKEKATKTKDVYDMRGRFASTYLETVKNNPELEQQAWQDMLKNVATYGDPDGTKLLTAPVDPEERKRLAENTVRQSMTVNTYTDNQESAARLARSKENDERREKARAEIRQFENSKEARIRAGKETQALRDLAKDNADKRAEAISITKAELKDYDSSIDNARALLNILENPMRTVTESDAEAKALYKKTIEEYEAKRKELQKQLHEFGASAKEIAKLKPSNDSMSEVEAKSRLGAKYKSGYKYFKKLLPNGNIEISAEPL